MMQLATQINKHKKIYSVTLWSLLDTITLGTHQYFLWNANIKSSLLAILYIWKQSRKTIWLVTVKYEDLLVSCTHLMKVSVSIQHNVFSQYYNSNPSRHLESVNIVSTTSLLYKTGWSWIFEIFPERGRSEFFHKKGVVANIGGCSKIGDHQLTLTNPF